MIYVKRITYMSLGTQSKEAARLNSYIPYFILGGINFPHFTTVVVVTVTNKATYRFLLHVTFVKM